MAVTGLALATAACGWGGGPTSSTVEDVRTTQIRSAVTTFATSADARAVCGQLSTGFRAFIADGDFSRTACVAHLAGVLGAPWRARSVALGSASEADGQTLVSATIDGKAQQFYLVPQYGTMKINSIGLREGLGPTPPPAEVYDQ